VVKVLLDAGADASLKDGFGNTALKYAKQNEDDEIVQLLRGTAKR